MSEITLNFNKKRELARKLARIVAYAGKIINENKDEVVDTRTHKGHDESSIDAVARSAIIEGIEKYAPELEGKLQFELMPFNKQLIEIERDSKYSITLIMDEIDGSTNTKRAKASTLDCVPNAAVCIALCTGSTLKDLQIGVVYTLDTKEIFSGTRVEDNEFLTLRHKEMLYPGDIQKMRGDSKFRVLVIKYSNQKRVEIAEVEEALWEAKFKPYEGCRSSTMDIIGVIRNQNDAYIDVRALFPEECGARLQAYDVAAVIPIAIGAGLVVTDVFGEPIDKYGETDVITLVVARPDIHAKIIEAIRPVVEKICGKYPKN
ncbi:MAG: inositol monophosphatase family protein [Candidatus Paceibacterota bacterium]|jgi:fructose-1,6-bisphosphatase/inositol monophosphatase family enzyme